MSNRNRHIARNFSRAAMRYEAHAALQHAIMLKAYQMLADRMPVSADILDVGCGTGSFSKQAKTLHVQWNIDGTDIAVGMCHVARPHYRHVVCADMCALPHETASYDGIFSNLAIQWAHHPQAAFAELARVLKPSGIAVVSTFLHGTLYELADMSAKVGLDSVMPMHPEALYQQAAADAGFAVLDSISHLEVHYLPSAQAVMENLHAIGAKNAKNTRRGMVGIGRFAELLSLYEKHYRKPEGVSVSWHSGIFVLQKCT